MVVLHGATSTILNNNTGGTVTPIGIFANNNPPNASNNVKAAINYIFFDDHFNYVTAGFDAVNSGSTGGLKSHFLQNVHLQIRYRGRFMGHTYYFSPIHAAFIERYGNNPANATLPTQE